MNVLDLSHLQGASALSIATGIEAAVHAARLVPGEALPTVRELSARLGVSPGTVAAAYRTLQSRGLVAGSGRRGTHVTARPPTPGARSRPLVPDGAVDLATGNPDPELLPPLDHALRSLPAASRLYDARAVLPALATFAAAEFAADGVAAEHVTVTGGGLDAVERLLREHLRAGDRVAVEDPAFPGVLDLLSAGSFVPMPVALDDEGPLPDSLEAALGPRTRALVVTPRAQNPTGAAITTARADALRRLLAAHPDVLVIEDDHAGPIAGAPAVTLCAGRARWAVVRSVSKFLGPDLRVAVMAGDALTVARVEGRLALGARWVSHILQQLALALWSDPSGARRLARAADIYRQRREALRAALAARGVASRGASGMNVWVPVREEAATVGALLERGWAVTPGERFRLRSPPGVRVTAAALKPSDADRFAADLAAVLQPSRAGSLA